VLTLIGAFLMFRLRRFGFWIYVAGTLAFVALPFWVYGIQNKLAYGLGMLVAVVGVVFVGLYWRNLRLMK
jgi:hypothetical protein